MKLTSLALALTFALAAVQSTDDTAPHPLQVGDPAPLLRLNDEHGDALALGGERETWTVLAFYPKALTPG